MGFCLLKNQINQYSNAVSYTHLRAHETLRYRGLPIVR